MQELLKNRYIPEIQKMDFYEGEKVEPPVPVVWYPDGLAWSMTTPKKVIRRYPPFASFQRFLVSETSIGNISRQELVSMIPPLLMDIEPHMTVLDLCAAPGSKTAQLAEMLHGCEESRLKKHHRELQREQHGGESGLETVQTEVNLDTLEDERHMGDHGRPTGLIIANDNDYQRSHMLIHQMKRLDSPNLIVTNHDATLFPSLRLTQERSSSAQPSNVVYLKYDRILADVPCSGDGTLRKNLNLWNDWRAGNAIGLHQTQTRILVRALQMLKVGGRVVYSTCSMNPVENEAVVASAIGRCGGLSKVEVVDCSQELPKLIRRPGLKKWNVMDRSGRIWNSWQEAEQGAKEGIDIGRLSPTMFPPAQEASGAGNDTGTLPLERCMRIYPHLQDTGGFFITVLRKKSEIKARPESEPKKPESKAPITAITEEIAATVHNEGNTSEDHSAPLDKIDALDKLLPPAPMELENPSATVRQNRENVPRELNMNGKHEQEDEEEPAAAKRIKTRDEPDEMALLGEADRLVHWPPPPAASSETPAPTPQHPVQPAPARKPKPQKGQQYEEAFKYLSADHPELNSIYEFYDVSPDFPMDRFMVRNETGEPVKAIYYTASLARDILTENEGKGIKFVHCGVKMFVKQEMPKTEICKWRIQSEGLPVLEPYVGEGRVVRLHKQGTLKKLLTEMFPKISNDLWKDLGEIGERVRDIGLGCCVLKVEPSDAPDGFR